MTESGYGVSRPRMEVEIAIGSVLGIPPSSIEMSAVVALDDAGRLWIAGPGYRSAEGRERVAWLLGEACTVLTGDGFPGECPTPNDLHSLCKADTLYS